MGRSYRQPADEVIEIAIGKTPFGLLGVNCSSDGTLCLSGSDRCSSSCSRRNLVRGCVRSRGPTVNDVVGSRLISYIGMYRVHVAQLLVAIVATLVQGGSPAHIFGTEKPHPHRGQRQTLPYRQRCARSTALTDPKAHQVIVYCREVHLHGRGQLLSSRRHTMRGRGYLPALHPCTSFTLTKVLSQERHHHRARSPAGFECIVGGYVRVAMAKCRLLTDTRSEGADTCPFAPVLPPLRCLARSIVTIVPF